MKKLISILITAIMLLSAFGCSTNDEGVSSGGTVKIVATTFAAYDWARCVAGDRNVEVTLVGGGADLHSFDPSADDILKVANSHILIYTGGESDSWVTDVSRRGAAKSINMLEVIGDEAYREHEHDAPDEHLWMSLNNAHIVGKAISDALSEFDPDGYYDYDENREQMSLKLNALDRKYKEAVGQYTLPSVIVADRFAIAYMLDYYHIVWYSAFSGCSTDIEASFSTVTELAKTVDRLDAKNIIVSESGDGAVATAIIDASAKKDCGTVVIDTMQSATESDSYLDIMTKNLDALKLALIEDTE